MAPIFYGSIFMLLATVIYAFWGTYAGIAVAKSYGVACAVIFFATFAERLNRPARRATRP